MTQPYTCFLNWFLERDIDMFLAEELRVNPSFSKWFARQAAPDMILLHPATQTRVSVPENGSETDVLATFQRSDGGLHRIWIENKISAGLMPQQLERYIDRANAEIARGDCDSCSVVLFAPAAHRLPTPTGVALLSFEAAAKAIASDATDARLRYRAELLSRAAAYATPARQAQNMIDHEPHIIDWWDRTHAMVAHEFDGYFAPPRTRYMREMFFAPRTPDLPSYLRVDCKLRRGEVDLAFKNIAHDALHRALKELDAAPGRLVENAKSTALRITGLPSVSFSTDPEGGEVKAAFAAVKELIDFWRCNRSVFDALAAETRRSL